MTNLMILNVGLFLCTAAAAALVAWLGWELSGDDDERRSGRGGGGPGVDPRPLADLPGGPQPAAGRDDLARSA